MIYIIISQVEILENLIGEFALKLLVTYPACHLFLFLHVLCSPKAGFACYSVADWPPLIEQLFLIINK